MIRDGVLEGPKVEKTLSLHLWNDKPLGWINIAKGPVMAGAELFIINITGKGGHGAAPDTTIDPVVASAHIITALQTITSRNVPPLQACVISVTAIHSGTTFNVIPQTAQLTGTIRTFDLGVRKMVLERFEQVVMGIAETLGCKAEIEIKRVTPAVINNDAIASSVFNTANGLFSDAQIDTENFLTMGAEDMGYMQEKVDGCYFFIGSANHEKNLNYNHHHPKFDFDEQALIKGTALMAAAAADLLK
jgi:amidohydrolase